MNVYDFDNTIYSGDSTADFYLFCLSRHKGIIKTFPRLIGAFTKFYVFRRGTKTAFKEKMYSFLPYADIERDISDFWLIHIKKIKAFYKELQRDDDLIISASPEFLLAPACKMLGVKNLIASRVDPKTGKYSGENCHGQEKVKRFREKYSGAEIEKFYSDSRSDTPLALIAKESYLVKNEEILPWRFTEDYS